MKYRLVKAIAWGYKMSGVSGHSFSVIDAFALDAENSIKIDKQDV